MSALRVLSRLHPLLGNNNTFRVVQCRWESTIIGSQRKKIDVIRDQNTLGRFIKDKIRATGPMTIAEYMKLCVSAPIEGYYTRVRDEGIFGEKGDFITSPEISQMFGELVGVWIVNELYYMGMGDGRKPWQLVELGPGTGALTADVVRVLKQFNLVQNLSLHLVEVSDHLAKEQCGRICHSESPVERGNDSTTWYQRGLTSHGNMVYWYRHLADVPTRFSVLVAHEFFDALPIHCFHRSEGAWKEVCVDVEEGKTELRFSLTSKETPAIRNFLPDVIREDVSVSEYEVSPESSVMVNEMADRVVEVGGMGLVVDYGHAGQGGWSLRGFKNHKVVSPLWEPGKADLTADVNFRSLQDTISDKVCTYGPINQGEFLLNLGLETRFQQLLAKCKTESEKEYIERCFEVMTSADEMGERFKVLAFFPNTLKEILDVRKAPAGFIPPAPLPADNTPK